MKNKIKVAMILRSFAVGGGESVVCQLISNIDKNNIDLYVICVASPQNSHLFDMVKKAYPNIVFLNKPTGFIPFYFFKMWKQLSTIRPQIIHTHLSSAIYTYPYVLFHKVKLVHTVHNLPNKDMTIFPRIVLWLLIKLNKAIPVAISEYFKKLVADYYGMKKECVPVVTNGVNLSKFTEKRNSQSSDINLIAVGALRPQKNYHYLIDVMNRVVKINSNVKLKIAGEGPDRILIESLIEQYHLENNIILLGTQDNIPYQLINSDIFILTSSYEGMPLVILEAMAAGLPIISNKVGGVPDIVKENRNGYLIEPGDIDTFVKNLIQLVENSELRKIISQNNLSDVKTYDISKMVKEYELLYDKLLLKYM